MVPNPGSTGISQRLQVFSPSASVVIPRIALALSPVQPNPAVAGALAVEFELPDAAPARLDLLDVAGRRIESQAVGLLGAGRHRLKLEPSGTLAAGIYLVRLSHGATSIVGRVALIR